MPTKVKRHPARERRHQPPPYMSGPTLRRWRLSQRDPRSGHRATLEQAAKWWGVHLRTWQYWEAGTNRVPRPLQQFIQRHGRMFTAEPKRKKAG